LETLKTGEESSGIKYIFFTFIKIKIKSIRSKGTYDSDDEESAGPSGVNAGGLNKSGTNLI